MVKKPACSKSVVQKADERRKQAARLKNERAHEVLRRMKKEGHWPFVGFRESRVLYEELFSVKLVATDSAYQGLRKIIDNAKAFYRKTHPTFD